MTEYPSKDNLRALIQFLATKGRQPMEIYARMKAVYGDYSYSHWWIDAINFDKE